MLFFTKRIKYKNIKLVNQQGKDICQFRNFRFETEDKRLIKILSDKNKYPWIFSIESEKINSGEVNAMELGIGEEVWQNNQKLNDAMNNDFRVTEIPELKKEK
jgi:hypothetical protein